MNSHTAEGSDSFAKGGALEAAFAGSGRALCAAWKLAAGAALSVGAIAAGAGGALLSIAMNFAVVGWTYRLAQRAAFKSWWRSSGVAKRRITFRAFAAGQADATLRDHRKWPNWIVGENTLRDLRERRGDRLSVLIRGILGALGRNIRLGFLGYANTTVVLLPALLVWLLGWHLGWNTSFNKQYEDFWVGVTVVWAANLYFLAAMFYLPMAQARQAVTGQPGRFWDFRLIRRLIRRRWYSALALAPLYAAAGAAAMVLTIAPFWLGQSEQVQAMDAGQQLGAISLYFFGAALIIFPMFALLRVAAAKVYASAMRRSVELGETAPDALSPQEHSTMTALGLLEPGAPPAPRWQTSRRFGSWVKTMPFRFAGGFIAVLFYFAGLIAPLFIAQFNVHRAKLWVNQPLVQMPWFQFIPGHLHARAAGEIGDDEAL